MNIIKKILLVFFFVFYISIIIMASPTTFDYDTTIGAINGGVYASSYSESSAPIYCIEVRLWVVREYIYPEYWGIRKKWDDSYINISHQLEHPEYAYIARGYHFFWIPSSTYYYYISMDTWPGYTS